MSLSVEIVSGDPTLKEDPNKLVAVLTEPQRKERIVLDTPEKAMGNVDSRRWNVYGFGTIGLIISGGIMIEGGVRFAEFFTQYPAASIAEGLKGAGELIAGLGTSMLIGNYINDRRSKINQIGQKLTEKIRSHFPSGAAISSQ